MTYFFALILAAQAGTDHFPAFYGDYRVASWTCESSIKDKGCMDSARLVIERSGTLSVVSVYNAAGARIRWNELVEKGGLQVLGGGAEFADFRVEARNSAGERYFYNWLEARRLSDGTVQFTHLSEQTFGGLNNTLKRVFRLEPR